MNTVKCSTHEFLLEQLKNYQGEKPHAKTVPWSYDMEEHAQKCVERFCELTNKKTEQLYNASNPCLDDRQFKKEELESVGDLSEVYVTRIGRPDILGKSEQICSISHQMDLRL